MMTEPIDNRERRPEHVEIIHVLLRYPTQSNSEAVFIHATRPARNATDDRAREDAIRMGEETVSLRRLSYEENKVPDFAGVYRVIQCKVTIPEEPSGPTWVPGKFEYTAEWEAHWKDIRKMVSRPDLWKLGCVVGEWTVGPAENS